MRRSWTTGSAGLAAWLVAAGVLLASGCAEEERVAEPATTSAADAPPEAPDADVAGGPENAAADADADDAPDVEAALDPEAVAVLKRMVGALESAKALRVRTDEEYDALQADGETLSFGKSSDMTLSRPDRLRIETAERHGAHRISTYDGKRITVYDSVRNVFATLERSGDFDSVVDFLRDEIGAKLPLAPLFSTQLRALLLEGVTSATYVDQETHDGVDVDHIAFHYGDGVGVQLWVPRSGDALPRRLVMTFEKARGRPQFRADFRSWELSPDVSEGVFAFAAPEGARSVPFVLPKRTVAPTGGEESQ